MLGCGYRLWQFVRGLATLDLPQNIATPFVLREGAVMRQHVPSCSGRSAALSSKGSVRWPGAVANPCFVSPKLCFFAIDGRKTAIYRKGIRSDENGKAVQRFYLRRRFG